MAVELQETTVKAYCNVLALQRGLDPTGYAGHFEDAVLIETRLPWKNQLYHEAGALPQEMIDLLGIWLQRYRDGQPYHHRPLLIAPDSKYSRPDFRRVIYYAHAPGAFAQYDKTEYLVPESELGSLLWSLFEAKDRLFGFDQYRVFEDMGRDLLVCTHGNIDAACAKFGYPLYNHLRRKSGVRVWRCSHFGGHVFAPTMIDMPTGHYWAYVGTEQADQIVERCDDVGKLRGHYRGWAGLEDGFLQAAERELWQREGWKWFEFTKTGTVLAQDPNPENPCWAEVRFEYASLNGTVMGRCEARVEVRAHIETISTTGCPDLYKYPQYVVTHME
ncbi:MAG: sucrase ferredoxin [Anaerolineae bacterium]|nr:sucrase ferredoxin [Anaerolineae bacterium]